MEVGLEDLGLAAAALLARAQQDHAVVGHDRGVVGELGVDVARHGSLAEDELGARLDERAAEGIVLGDHALGVRTGAPAVGLPRVDVLHPWRTHVHASELPVPVLDRHGRTDGIRAAMIAPMTGTGDPTVFVRELRRWGRAHRRSFPWRETADPFRILVAEVLLQRSRGVTVAKVYEALFARWPDAGALARARVSSIGAVIRPLGLVRRAATLRAMAGMVARDGVPRDAARLEVLPGVGRYAASATLAAAYDRRAPVVDGVTARVYRRYFGLPTSAPAVADRALWELVERVTPVRAARTWNWAVLDLAALVCVPSRPRCDACPLAATCTWNAAR